MRCQYHYDWGEGERLLCTPVHSKLSSDMPAEAGTPNPPRAVPGTLVWSSGFSQPGFREYWARRFIILWLAVALIFVLTTGCRETAPPGALVLTQIPLATQGRSNAQDVLDQRYPTGSRVVMVWPPFRLDNIRILSRGLIAAGSPVVSPNSKRIYFAGKTVATGVWQVYAANLRGGSPKLVTQIAGGAMDPAIIANGDLVFSSPVPKVGETWKSGTPAALYAQSRGGPPRLLTFGTYAAVEPTVLRDGKILFISAHPSAHTNASPELGLFTINDDGTEVTPFALDHDGAPLVHRPRELPGGKVGFIASGTPGSGGATWAESVRTARPFLSRTHLLAFATLGCRSVEPDGEDALLMCLDSRGKIGRSMNGSCSVYRFNTEAKSLGERLFDDPAWNQLEAVRLRARPKPIGHISAMKPEKRTGTILCLNANFTRSGATNGSPTRKVERVRVITGSPGQERRLGEIAAQEDGSFMAEVPADTALGFETLDAMGSVLNRLSPTIWVRPGENRSCLGCHEPYNHTPRNLRPKAISVPCPEMGEKLSAVSTTPIR